MKRHEGRRWQSNVLSWVWLQMWYKACKKIGASTAWQLGWCELDGPGLRSACSEKTAEHQKKTTDQLSGAQSMAIMKGGHSPACLPQQVHFKVSAAHRQALHAPRNAGSRNSTGAHGSASMRALSLATSNAAGGAAGGGLLTGLKAS